MNRSVVHFLGAWTLMELAQWMGSAAVTYLMFASGGVARVAVVQAVPLLVVSVGAPFMGVLLDHLAAKRVIVAATCLFSAKSLGHLWLQWQWYAGLMVIDAVLMAALAQAYVRLLPVLIVGSQIDRVSGWASLGTSVARTLGLAAGPFLAFHLHTGVFVIVAAGLGLAGALLACVRGDALPAARLQGRGLGAVARGLVRGARHLWAGRERISILILFLLAHVLWGLDDALALPIAEHVLGIAPAWAGTYAAVGTLAEMAGALLIARGLLGSGARVVARVGGALVLLGATCWAVLYARSPEAGFVLKFLGGLASVVIGILCQNALVLRHPVELRARLLGLLTAMGGLVMVAGKAVAGYLSATLAVVTIYAGAGVLIMASVTVLLVLPPGRRRRA